MDWINREAGPLIRQTAAQRPAPLPTGCRQTGKTSLLQNLFPKHSYVLAGSSDDGGGGGGVR